MPSPCLKIELLSSGGDGELLQFLKDNGFCSKMSLKKLEFNCPEGNSLMQLLSYGKQCLLRALVETLLKEEDSAGCSSYSSGATKAANLGRKTSGIGIKDKITKLFNFHTGGSTSNSAELADDKDFELRPSFRQFGGGSGSKGKKSLKRSGGVCKVGPMKRKVKQVVLPVVGVLEDTSRTPTGAERAKLSRDVWVKF